MRMKTLYLLCGIVMTMLFAGCGNDEKVEIPSTYLTLKDASCIAFEYLELKGESYVLNLLEDDALEMGISPKDYQTIKKDVLLANAAIYEAKHLGKGQLQLINPQNVDIQFGRVVLKHRREVDGDAPKPDGSGYMPDDQYVTIYITVPVGCSSVNFEIYSNSVIGVCSAALFYAGEVYSGGSCTSSFLTGSGSCNLSVPMGGDSYRVDLRVSSSFGGSYSYFFQ